MSARLQGEFQTQKEAAWAISNFTVSGRPDQVKRTKHRIRFDQIKSRSEYQLKVDVDMLSALKNNLADISSVSPSSEGIKELVNTLYCLLWAALSLRCRFCKRALCVLWAFVGFCGLELHVRQQ